MRIAIVHEWFATYAGSERVVEQLLHLYPNADLFALVDSMSTDTRPAFLKNRAVKTSFIQKLPFALKKFRGYLPLMPLAVEQFDLAGYDLILSSNHAVAKGIIRAPDQLHISYVHTPIRYAWDLQAQYLRESNLQKGPKSWLARIVLHYMRLWDQAAANRVDLFVANSHYIANRIWAAYRREAQVIHPPVDVNAFSVGHSKEDFYLTASRLVPYKRVDVVVEAFKRHPDKKLLVIGDGPDLKKIQKLAGPNVQLLGHQPFSALRDHMQRAKAFVFAAEEDFGIMPVEAMACGTPVIAFGKGGSRETVHDQNTGLFFDAQTPESVADAITRFESLTNLFSPAEIRQSVESFSPDLFRDQFDALVQSAWDKFQSRRHYTRPAQPVSTRTAEPASSWRSTSEHSLTR